MLRFSIITPSFNQGSFIRQNIESVLSQDYKSFEHIVVDGGSTDETLKILKGYPHLKWKSEPDRGQSHALNKGFSVATGDIIGWLNSDDWYEPNIFTEVAAALEEYPIVMGACGMTDREGVVSHVVPNVERSWSDILKYWVFYATPTQPSLFFRRDLLDAVKREDGRWIDEDLEYCMDYDLWLRMSTRVKFSRRITRTLAYYRDYGTNKTGANMPAAYREMGRVFSRHAGNCSGGEARFGFVIPVSVLTDEVMETIASIEAQDVPGCEVLCVATADTMEPRELRKVLLARNSRLSLRVSTSQANAKSDALNIGAQELFSPYIALISPGTTITSSFVRRMYEEFSQNLLGFILPPVFNDKELPGLIADDGSVRWTEIFRRNYSLPEIIVRKVALIDAGGVSGASSISIQKLLLSLTNKVWKGKIAESSLWKILSGDASEKSRIIRNYIIAELIRDIRIENAVDSFASVRKEHGFTVEFPDDYVAAAEDLLSRAPKDWSNLEWSRTRDELEKTIKEHPQFAPAWAELAKLKESLGDVSGAKVSHDRYMQLQATEPPLSAS